MEIVNVLAAAAAAWIYGAVHYMVLSKPWIRVSGAKVDADGKPLPQALPALPFILSFIAMILVAGMMRHVLKMATMDTVGGGVMVGFGIGAFFITPWVMMNNAYPGRPFLLTIIDGAYAIIGCTIIGVVLQLF